MRKRELCKYADPGLKFSLGSGVLLLSEKRHIVRAAVRNIAGRRTLVLYFYNRARAAAGCFESEYTLFQRRDDYISLSRTNGGSMKWHEASLENLGERYACFTKTCAFYRQRDEQLVTRFCHIGANTGFDALNALQAAVMSDRLKKRIAARERKTVERMRPVKAAPRGLKGWIHREVLPHYVFYDHRRSKVMKGYCTACRSDVLVSGAKNNIAGVCPECKKSVTFKASGRSKRVWDRVTAIVLQKTSENELVVRLFKVYNRLREWRQPNLTIQENARIFVHADNNDNKARLEPYYYSYSKGTLTKWHPGERPKIMLYHQSFEAELYGKLYCGNLERTLSGTPWQYSQLKQFSMVCGGPMEVHPYLRAYLEYPMIEYLMKLGLEGIVGDLVYRGSGNGDVINTNGKNIKDALKVQAEDIPYLQSIKADIAALRLLQAFRAHEGRFEKELCQWCHANGVTFFDVKGILKHTTGVKLLRYIHQQFGRDQPESVQHRSRRYGKITDVLHDYSDYLRNGEELAYDFSDSFVLFPRHLDQAHDLAVSVVEARRKAERDRLDKQRQAEASVKMAEFYKALLRKFKFTKDGLTVIPPKSAEDIVFEGHALHHCVGQRYSSHASGGCVILFVRKKDKIDEPFCTMEVQGDKVIQLRGYDNKEPEKEVKDFISAWEQKKLSVAAGQKAA